MTPDEMRHEYGIAVGDCVAHLKDNAIGYVIGIDCNLQDITTCYVAWDVSS